MSNVTWRTTQGKRRTPDIGDLDILLVIKHIEFCKKCKRSNSGKVLKYCDKCWTLPKGVRLDNGNSAKRQKKPKKKKKKSLGNERTNPMKVKHKGGDSKRGPRLSMSPQELEKHNRKIRREKKGKKRPSSDRKLAKNRRREKKKKKPRGDEYEDLEEITYTESKQDAKDSSSKRNSSSKSKTRGSVFLCLPRRAGRLTAKPADGKAG